MKPMSYYDRFDPRIRKEARRAREKMISMPNYTPFRICDICRELGIEVAEEDIPGFIRCFDRRELGKPDYDVYRFRHGSYDKRAFTADTYVCRDHMVRGFQLNEITRDKHHCSIAFDWNHEIKIRYYDEQLIRGIILPVSSEEYLEAIRIADKWRDEIVEKYPDCECIDYLPTLADPLNDKEYWQIRFCRDAEDPRRGTSADLFDPQFNHARDLLGILCRNHLEIEQIFAEYYYAEPQSSSPVSTRKGFPS